MCVTHGSELCKEFVWQRVAHEVSERITGASRQGVRAAIGFGLCTMLSDLRI